MVAALFFQANFPSLHFLIGRFVSVLILLVAYITQYDAHPQFITCHEFTVKTVSARTYLPFYRPVPQRA
jgi:uncharacterized membrane protein